MTVKPGFDYMNNPLLNKGTAFSKEERASYQLDGLLPPIIETIEQQAVRIETQIENLETPLHKHQLLTNLYNENRTLYYYVVTKNVTDYLPIIYTPTIGDAVIQYHKEYTAPDEALFIDAFAPEKLSASIKNYAKNNPNIDMIVITDGEGVLGIGDWGVNGVKIAVGKLAVYTVAAGLAPDRVLPVVIDAGTNNETLLNDPLYLGNKRPRLSESEYDAFIASFVNVMKEVFPKAILHWEDFGRANASRILHNYRDKICTFNDDIQGTGAMVVAAVLATIQVSKIPLSEQKIIIFGAGTAGIGIADQLSAQWMRETGLPFETAKKHFYLVDRNGLVLDNMTDLTTGQKKYAHPSTEWSNVPTDTLENLMEAVHPTMLIGCSGVTGAFKESIVKKMTQYTERPAILPLSNPTKLAEATASDLIQWTDGKALIVTGSPSKPVEYQHTTYEIGQANNALLYPGLGLGALVTRAKYITDGMLAAASMAVAEQISPNKAGAALLPHVRTLRETSRAVAIAVANQAIKENIHQVELTNVTEAIEREMWQPIYKGV
ncbi:NAD-dependent malic enzyme [Listeria monocytogenes]|uniref:NAD-dependent malic enzyme n=1 Tax=Listeria monocytogenes TaxID=1639 RepID=A0A2Z5BXC5_LISMN|nr:NAD-dependent malic enzyme [Listeria monocytogenes]EAE3765898.1 NAD-dependent malic enzyme [Listeria monocytogenes serotype 1/2b]EAF3078136.1 NAD-dependent malic enzyme [Listeria monocytogenes serotype 1/2a]EAF4545383.1 NAD-dependent malic enzyme [Listeria monocytogenes serotype 4b]EAG6332103.1 NAD-dependent malic enzyme [Listeria monocytogenes CFSAN002346]EAG6373788.1 NAD-dependent malic enzyme [Listeria monocytogenes CFSAN002356]EGC3053233.1 NAD-dependent malic enzyme [Listeria monocytog